LANSMVDHLFYFKSYTNLRFNMLKKNFEMTLLYALLSGLDYWIGSARSNAALVVLVSGHFDVTFVSPFG